MREEVGKGNVKGKRAGVAERVNSCVVVSYLGRATSPPSPNVTNGSSSLSLFLLLLLLPFALPQRPHSLSTGRAARFKYQRRLKSDLYHAESCYLYRLIRDLPVRYFEGTPLLAPVSTGGANILRDKRRPPTRSQCEDRGEGGKIRTRPWSVPPSVGKWPIVCASRTTRHATADDDSRFSRREREGGVE